MKIEFIKQCRPWLKEYLALEDGVILTSAGDHPGPRGIKLFLKKGNVFQIKDEYFDRNDFTVISKEQTTPVKHSERLSK